MGSDSLRTVTPPMSSVKGSWEGLLEVRTTGWVSLSLNGVPFMAYDYTQQLMLQTISCNLASQSGLEVGHALPQSLPGNGGWMDTVWLAVGWCDLVNW